MCRTKFSDTMRELHVHEELWEKGGGLPPESGGGWQKEVYQTGKNREGKISARFSLLAPRFRFDFDYTQFHRELENLAQGLAIPCATSLFRSVRAKMF
jgi:hypothetical protein